MSVRVLTLFLLSFLPAFASLGTPVLLTVTDRSGVSRSNEGVTTGVPLPASAGITDVRNLMLTTAPSGACAGGVAVDSQLTVTERWNGQPTDTSKAIRWLWVETVIPSVSANGSSYVCLADRSGADPGTTHVTITNSGGFITVATGAMTFKVSTTAFNFIDTVQVGATTVVSSSASNTWKITANGTDYTTSNNATSNGYSATTEHIVTGDANSAGEQIKAQILVTGKFTSAGSTQLFDYKARIIAYANGQSIKVLPLNTFTADMFATANKPSQDTVLLPLQLSGTVNYTYGGQSGTITGTANGTTDTVALLQYDHGHATPVSMPGYVVEKNGTSVSTGTRAPGWFDVNDGTKGVTVSELNFWQRYPAELRLSGTTLHVGLWPEDANMVVPTVGDGVTGINTQVYNNKISNALNATATTTIPTKATGVIWPSAPGSLLDFTPIAPNEIREILTVNQGTTSTFTAAGFNYQDTTEGYCANNPTNNGCYYWPIGSTKQIHVSNFTGCWAALNGTYNAINAASSINPVSGAWTVTVQPSPAIDTSACTLPVTPTMHTGVSTDPRASMIDVMTDMQYDGVALEWELQFYFYAGSVPTAANTAAALQDRLMLVNPNWLASTDAFGHIDAVNASYPTMETNVTNAWNAFTSAADTWNYYGLPHYGNFYYDTSNPVPAGYGARTYISSRKQWQLVPWMMWARTGNSTFLPWAVAITNEGMDTDMQHHTTGVYTDANNNIVDKHVGATICSHLPTHQYPTTTLTTATYALPCSEGQEPALDYVSEAAEAAYVLAGYDRGYEIVMNEQLPWLSLVNTTQLITDSISGRSFGGCLQFTLAAYRLSGSSTALSLAETCFDGAINHTNGSGCGGLGSLGNPVGMLQGDCFGNSINWGGFTASWATNPFAELDIIDPSHAALDSNGVSHTVNQEFLRVAKAHMGMGLTTNTTYSFFYNFQGKLWAQAYRDTGDPIYLSFGKRMWDQYQHPFTEIVGSNNYAGSAGDPDIHHWSQFMLNVPYAERGLDGTSPTKPDNPPYQNIIPSDGSTLTYYVHKSADQAWTFSFQIDTQTGWDTGGDFPLAGTVTVDVIGTDGVTNVSHNVLTACTFGVSTPCIANSWWQIQGPSAVAGQGLSVTYGGKDNRVITITVPADGTTGDYTVQFSAVLGSGGTCSGNGGDRYTCFTHTHYLMAFGSSLGNWTMYTPSILGTCSLVDTPHVGRGLYYFNVPNTAAQIKISFSRLNYFLTSPSGNIYNYGSTSTIPLEPGIWTLTTDSALDNGGNFCFSMKGVKPLISASPQTYYDSPAVAVNSTTLQDYGGTITVNFSGGSPQLTVSPASLTFNCVTGVGGSNPANQTVTVGSTGVTLDNWSASKTQTWLNLSPTSGTSAGTFTASITGCSSATPGTYTDTITVASTTSGIVNSPVSVPVTYHVTVSPPPVITITTSTPLPGTPTHEAYSTTLTVSGGTGPYTWALTAGTIPTGLTLSSGGVLSGIATVVGQYSFTVVATDSGGNASTPTIFDLAISPATTGYFIGRPSIKGTVIRRQQ